MSESATEAGSTSAERQMFETMARMQDEHNYQVHPQWRTQGYEYYRAIWVECAELLDHFGWKWWKHQTPDLEQSRLELVDIWHFGLSELIRDEVALDQALAGLARLPAHPSPGAVGHEIDGPEFRLAVEALAGEHCKRGRFHSTSLSSPRLRWG